MTRRLATFIGAAGLQLPYAEIARRIGISEATVSEICTAHIERLNAAYRPAMPVVRRAVRLMGWP